MSDDLREAFRSACLRLQTFLDTFGDVGGATTQADINDWLELAKLGQEHDIDLLTPLKNAAATIGAIYEWLERVEKNGGATSASGVASCHAMLTSLRKNAARTEKLIMEPVRAVIAKAGGRS